MALMRSLAEMEEVPAALAGSMAREKKPFTYLPGGLDFSEIRSPRMAKRIARHQANLAKVQLARLLTRVQAFVFLPGPVKSTTVSVRTFA